MLRPMGPPAAACLEALLPPTAAGEASSPGRNVRPLVPMFPPEVPRRHSPAATSRLAAAEVPPYRGRMTIFAQVSVSEKKPLASLKRGLTRSEHGPEIQRWSIRTSLWHFTGWSRSCEVRSLHGQARVAQIRTSALPPRRKYVTVAPTPPTPHCVEDAWQGHADTRMQHGDPMSEVGLALGRPWPRLDRHRAPLKRPARNEFAQQECNELAPHTHVRKALVAPPLHRQSPGQHSKITLVVWRHVLCATASAPSNAWMCPQHGAAAAKLHCRNMGANRQPAHVHDLSLATPFPTSANLSPSFTAPVMFPKAHRTHCSSMAD